MDYYAFVFVLPSAFLLDLILGDPRILPHPIRWMGTAIAAAEPTFRRLPGGLRAAGTLFAIFLITSVFILSWMVVSAAFRIHPAAGFLIQTLMIYYSISTRSLEQAAMKVYQELKRHDLSAAKGKLAMIVGRDVTKLEETGVIRGAVETVAENLVDGVISPLFYAAIGGAPLAMAYKMINTLDSMVGYKNDRYIKFGTASARLDDLANFLPARLSVPVIALAAGMLAGRGTETRKTAREEGANHSSPNAGYPEAAFAGALGIKINGPNVYHGTVVNKPFIGIRFGDAKLFHIPRACDLMLLSALLWMLTVWMLSVAVTAIF